MAKELEVLTKKADKRVSGVTNVMYSDGISEVAILNSNGLSDSYNTTIALVYVNAISRKGKDASTGDYFGISRNPSDIGLADIAAKAAERSVSILGGQKIESQPLDIVLDPMVAAQFMAAGPAQIRHAAACFDARAADDDERSGFLKFVADDAE